MHTQRGAHSKASGAMAGAAVRAFPSIIGLCRAALREHQTLSGPRVHVTTQSPRKSLINVKYQRTGTYLGKKARERWRPTLAARRCHQLSTQNQNLKVKSRMYCCSTPGFHEKVQKGTTLFFERRLNFVCGYRNKINNFF